MRREMHQLAIRDDTYITNETKYADRGWKAVNVPILRVDDPNVNTSLESMRPRHVGDSKTWKMSLDIAGVTIPDTPDYVLEGAHFSLLPNLRYLTISASSVDVCALKYRYTYCTRRSTDFWNEFVYSRLREFTLAQLEKVDQDQLPFDLQGDMEERPLYYLNGNFERPANWEYADHLIPGWLKEWEIWLPEALKREQRQRKTARANWQNA